VVVEDHLDGPELSVFAMCTGAGAVPLAPARDYKRLLEGDLGPNTGGMGAFSPVDLPVGLIDEVMTEVVDPTLQVMRDEGTPFLGVLYVGLVLTGDGPRVLEFNVSLGDPETQVVIPRMTTDLLDVMEGAVPSWTETATVDVVLTAPGYPAEPETGDVIHGLDQVPDDVLVFHAGTASDGDDLQVAGGRVLNVVGQGDDLGTARDRAYAAVDRISWPGMRYRADIASV
jgi:phosphoribosylamine--glycine ligase